jgi:hypothetical protein
MLKDFPKCAWEITRIRRHSLVGEPGRGGDLDLKLFLNNPYLREKRDMRNQQKSCVLFFFFWSN